MYIIMVGGGKVGYYLTKHLLSAGHEVVVIEKNPRKVEMIIDDLGGVAIEGDGSDAGPMSEAGMNRADIVVAATGDDEDNLIVCQVAKKKFNVKRTIARINNPKNEHIFGLLMRAMVRLTLNFFFATWQTMRLSSSSPVLLPQYPPDSFPLPTSASIQPSSSIATPPRSLIIISTFRRILFNDNHFRVMPRASAWSGNSQPCRPGNDDIHYAPTICRIRSAPITSSRRSRDRASDTYSSRARGDRASHDVRHMKDELAICLPWHLYCRHWSQQ